MAENHDKLDLDKLRRRALEVFKGKAPASDLKLSEAEMLMMIHEIEVYRVELRMLQDELDRSDEQLDEINEKYDELSEIHNRFILQMVKGHKFPGNHNPDQ